MRRVGLRPFYRHFAAGLFLCPLLLPVPRCHGFIVRTRLVNSWLFRHSSKK